MQRVKLLGLAGMIAVAVVLISTAGAGAKPVSIKRIDLSTRTAVAKYLHSVGVNPKGVVIQRGRFNYAGPNCPGKRWTCTKSHRVVQVAVGDGENKFECTDNTVAAPDCVIIQGNAKNKVKCVERIKSSDPVVTEHCSIDQTGRDNKADVDMLIVQTGSPDQLATQDAHVQQHNTDDGHNDSHVTVQVLQKTGSEHGAAATFKAAEDPTAVEQNQNVQQTVNVFQFGDGAANNDSHADSWFTQQETAMGFGDVTQNQNTSGDPNGDVSVQQFSNGGVSDSHLNIDGSSFATAKHNGGTVMQTQGSPFGGLTGHSSQSTEGEPGLAPLATPQTTMPGRSSLDATINETMHAVADQAAVQEQHGPTACCSFQSGNPAKDGEKITELIDLQTSSLPAVQTDLNLLDCNSDNPTGCNGRIRANLNGNVGMASCFNNMSPCHVGLVCSSVESEGACVPTPCINTGEGCFVPPPCYPSCIGASPSRGSSHARRE